eukprot:scaffold87314_cov20-Tisochrysis_lutea.AAC.1
MRQLEASTREEAALSCAQAWGVLRVWARDDEGWWCAVIGAAICRDRQDRPYMFGSHTCTAKKLSYDANCMCLATLKTEGKVLAATSSSTPVLQK